LSLVYLVNEPTDKERDDFFSPQLWHLAAFGEISRSQAEANSFICLIEIQAKNVFFRVFASTVGEIFVFPDDF
jgi:hypothetical protein